MVFGGALYKRDKDGGPWVPPWWCSFLLLPLLTTASFYAMQAERPQNGSPWIVKGVDWNQIIADGVVLYVAQFMAFYFIAVLPIFLLRRYLWEKRQKQNQDQKQNRQT